MNLGSSMVTQSTVSFACALLLVHQTFSPSKKKKRKEKQRENQTFYSTIYIHCYSISIGLNSKCSNLTFYMFYALTLLFGLCWSRRWMTREREEHRSFPPSECRFSGIIIIHSWQRVEDNNSISIKVFVFILI